MKQKHSLVPLFLCFFIGTSVLMSCNKENKNSIKKTISLFKLKTYESRIKNEISNHDSFMPIITNGIQISRKNKRKIGTGSSKDFLSEKIMAVQASDIFTSNSNPPILNEDDPQPVLFELETSLNFSSTAIYLDDVESVPMYYTPFNQNVGIDGGLISLVLNDNALLSVLSINELIQENQYIGHLYNLDGESIGTITITNGIVNREVSTSPASVLTMGLRSWWQCTQNCQGDAHAACYQNPDCRTMISIANIGGTFVRRPGLGSASIIAACAISCAKNTNFDLTPPKPIKESQIEYVTDSTVITTGYITQ